MGLLDDAIREHLDLKRRRGADPADIERAEREALGPVRRNREPTAEAAVAGDAPVAQSAYDEPDEGVATDLVEAAPDHDTSSAPELAVPTVEDDAELEDDWAYEDAETRIVTPRDESPGTAEPAPAESPSAPHDFVDDDDPFADTEEPFTEERGPFASTAPVAPGLGEETAEFDVEEALAAEEAAAVEPASDDDDVLEETPEFLQDTPDHDRLWFEQRPPRDFDFDG